MKLTIDLRHDEIADLHKALSLITEAVSERTGQKPATIANTMASPQTPTIDQLRQNQQQSQSSSSQPTSTGLFAPKQAQQASQSNSSHSSSFLPQSPPRDRTHVASNSQESFNMLNILGRKK